MLTVETEKAVDDVEAPASGVLRKIVADVGSEVPVMGAVAVITAPGEELTDDDLAGSGRPSSGATAAGRRGRRRAPRARRAQAARDASGRVNASPAARKRAGELGIDLATVEATGPVAAITSDDVERAAADVAATAAAPRAEVVELADGTKIAALVAGPADAPETIVFLHGLGGSQITWASVLGDFAETYRVAAVDLPGPRRQRQTVARRRPTTRSRASPRGSASCSRSWSCRPPSSSATRSAARRRCSSRSTVQARPRRWCWSTAPASGREISGELLDRIESEPSRDEARRLLELFFEDRRFVLERGIDDMYAARTAPGADEAVRRSPRARSLGDGQRLVLVDRLGELEVPLLVIWGELDRVIPSTHAVAAADALPTAWLEIMEGVGPRAAGRGGAGIRRDRQSLARVVPAPVSEQALVGIIANPASGKDIRRLVAHGSTFDNNEKINIVRRVLLGLDAAGVRRGRVSARTPTASSSARRPRPQLA